MKDKRNRRDGLVWLVRMLEPVALCVLFLILRRNREGMDLWVFGVLAPLEQGMGRLWSAVPFSVAELLTAAGICWSVAQLLRALWAAAKRRWGLSARRLAALVTVWLWVACGLCWLWNTSYYASGFAQRSGLEVQPYHVEQLAEVADYFAQNAARLSSQVPRDGQGHFDADLESCMTRGEELYAALTQEFPCLSMQANRAKPLIFSRLQSRLGFTGVYFPFTGEANVNVDAPACLVPATIAHEMAHQRMVASELEANFVGIAACISSEDVVFQYSGYLMGLIQLCNALHSVDSQLWRQIAAERFTPTLRTDWDENNAYWASMRSPVEEAAGDAYDAFLKGNGQELGMRSYGACVDLLVMYYADRANAG